MGHTVCPCISILERHPSIAQDEQGQARCYGRITHLLPIKFRRVGLVDTPWDMAEIEGDLPELNYYFVPIIIVTVSTYFIADVFFNVYAMAVDTLFLCYLEVSSQLLISSFDYFKKHVYQIGTE